MGICRTGLRKQTCYKRDAPSGTALSLAESVHSVRGGLGNVFTRNGEKPRKKTDLGISVARGGDVSGEHTVFFFGDGERIELTHRSTTADVFAAGALRAVCWLITKAPGRYTMRDVLNK